MNHSRSRSRSRRQTKSRRVSSRSKRSSISRRRIGRRRIGRRRIGGWGSPSPTPTKDNNPFFPSLLSGGWGGAPELSS